MYFVFPLGFQHKLCTSHSHLFNNHLKQNLHGGWTLKTNTEFHSVQSLSYVQLFAAWTAACQASLSITNSHSLLKFMAIKSVMPSNHLIFCCPLLLHLWSFPALGSFQMSQFFASGGQSIGASTSASVLPMNKQDWFPLAFGLISLQSKGLSRVFSNTTVQKHQFFRAQLSVPILHMCKILSILHMWIL